VVVVVGSVMRFKRLSDANEKGLVTVSGFAGLGIDSELCGMGRENVSYYSQLQCRSSSVLSLTLDNC
jgi:hypothetical protein